MSVDRDPSTRVGRSYKTTIPREVRRLLELGVNDTLEWVYENGRVYVEEKDDLSG